jgi:uncharacterized protein YndB with AHSA1/START domain
METMTTLQVSGVINRPVEDVWNVLSNPENAPIWSHNAIEEKLTSPRPVRVGTTRRAVVKGLGGGTMENHAVCTEFEPNRRIAWQTTSARLPFHVVVDFAPVDGGTRIDSVWTLQLPTLLRPASPIIVPYMRRLLERDVAHLKALMEAGKL